MLAAVFGGIEAHRQGLTDLVSIGSNTKTDMNNGESTHTALWHCRDAEGAGRDLEASFAVSSGKLTAATTKTGESTREAPARKTPTPGVPTPRGR